MKSHKIKKLAKNFSWNYTKWRNVFGFDTYSVLVELLRSNSCAFNIGMERCIRVGLLSSNSCTFNIRMKRCVLDGLTMTWNVEKSIIPVQNLHFSNFKPFFWCKNGFSFFFHFLNSKKMCFCTFENVKKNVFFFPFGIVKKCVLVTKMDFFSEF